MSKVLVFFLLFSISALNSLLFSLPETPLTGDAEYYNLYAKNIAEGRGYTLSDESFSTYREPGYPLFLAGIYRTFGVENFQAVRIAHIFLVAFAALFIYLAFRELSNKRLGLIGASLAAAIPYFGYNTNVLMSELLFSFFLSLSFYLLIRILKKDSGYLSLGLVFGMAALTRSILVFFPLATAVLMLYLRKERQKILAFIGIFIILVGSWVLFVHKNTGRYAITEGRLDIHIYTRAVRSTLSYKDQLYYVYSRIKSSALGGEQNAFLDAYEEKVLYLEYAERVNKGESADKIEKENIKIILKNFDGFLLGNLAEWVKLMYIEHVFPPVPTFMTRAMRSMFYIFLYGFFFLGSIRFILKGDRNLRIIFWLSFFYLAYNWILASSVDAHSRFNTPYLYFYLIMGMAGFAGAGRIKPSSALPIRKNAAAVFDAMAPERDEWKDKNRYYYDYLEKFMAFLIPPNRTVLETGSGTGDLLAGLRPSRGLGIDVSPGMTEIAKKKHKDPGIEFQTADVHDWSANNKFDFIVLSDTVGYLNDIDGALKNLSAAANPQTRIIITQYGHIWEPVLKLGSLIGLKMPVPDQNWLSRNDIENFLHLAGYETIKSGHKMLLPIYIPLISAFCNRFLVNIWPFDRLAFFYYVIARPVPNAQSSSRLYSVSIVIPARNETGMIKRLIDEIPDLGRKTELIFVENNSTDNTAEVLEKEISDYRGNKSIKHMSIKCRGKKEAVYAGFDMAKSDILMIYDADMTVPPEELIKFYDTLVRGRGEFINGSRLVYPMEKQSMKTANYIGNKFFSSAFSWLLGQRIKDTLCGTKVLWREDYRHIKDGLGFFGDFDRWGDFDLLFGAAKLNLKIVDLPVHYRERTYGISNMRRWRHGWMLLKMTFFAAKKIKFI